MLLSGKKALVTGSSRGIGLGVAVAFLRHGAHVVLSSERSLDESSEITVLLQSGQVRMSKRTCHVMANRNDWSATRGSFLADSMCW